MSESAQMAPTPSPGAGPAAKPKDIGWVGLAAIFYAPGQVFDSLNNRSWKIPVLASVVVALLSAYLLVNLVGMENLARMQFDKNPQLAEQLGHDKVEQMIQEASQSNARRIMTYVMVPVVGVIGLLIVAGVFMLGNLMIGSDIPFGRTLAIVAYAMFAPGLIRQIGSGAVFASIKDFQGFDITNPLPVNAALFVDPSAKVLSSFAASMDLLSFWTIYLIALGLQRATPKSSLGKHLGMVVAFWLVWVIVKSTLLSRFGF